ncbi:MULTISPECIES: hypothetical protein [unclassified Streptomyces]|uniref:hypothetical protein n=1 Tax=unclassified Streptomyces TaxID=2593676 RepID=UPI003BB49CCC
MTTGCKTTTVFLTILCGLLLAILGLTQGWPTWAWLTLALLLAVAPPAVFKIVAARRGALPADFGEHLTAAPVERREHHVNGVALPSHWADYDFLFSATVRWCPAEATGGDHGLNPAGLAVEEVLDRARAITEQREPGRASLVQHELSGALSRMRLEHTGHLHVMAKDVTLTLREHDQERLDKLAEVRKDKAVWEHQRKYEQSKREYLGDDVLKDTGSAVVWWLAKNDDHVEKTVGDLGLLAQLTSAANDTDVPERLRDFILQPHGEQPAPGPLEEPSAPVERDPSAADHFEGFLNGMGVTDGDVQRMLAKQIADIIKTQGRHETAEELLRRFDPSADFATGDDGPSDSADDATDETPRT